VSQGNGSFTVLNNTVAFNETALLLSGRAELGATVSAVVANNIFAFNAAASMSWTSSRSTSRSSVLRS
jgi:hypothetical protein